MRILVINCGSSSIKHKTFDMNDGSVLASGILERIGETGGRILYQWRNPAGGLEKVEKEAQSSDHREGFRIIMDLAEQSLPIEERSDLSGIGHRVVHGGEHFREPALIDEAVVKRIRDVAHLAPLHNPVNLVGIEAARQFFPHLPQVAVFDTAFHQTMPPHAFHYAIPHRIYTEHHIRRYGFHGTSHQYVAKVAARYLGRPLATLNLITFHLGNGASATAVRNGRSVDTSMGLTPLEGLIMGTRCGDLDPAIHHFLARKGMSLDAIYALLNNESGLKGICGSNDMREIKARADAEDQTAKLAIDMFCYRIKKYVGAYTTVLGRIDALVFTGGIGENASFIRRQCCDGLGILGIHLDEERNGNPGDGIAEIQRSGDAVKILVIRTDEEREIAQQTLETIRTREGRGPSA